MAHRVSMSCRPLVEVGIFLAALSLLVFVVWLPYYILDKLLEQPRSLPLFVASIISIAFGFVVCFWLAPTMMDGILRRIRKRCGK